MGISDKLKYWDQTVSNNTTYTLFNSQAADRPKPEPPAAPHLVVPMVPDHVHLSRLIQIMVKHSYPHLNAAVAYEIYKYRTRSRDYLYALSALSVKPNSVAAKSYLDFCDQVDAMLVHMTPKER